MRKLYLDKNNYVHGVFPYLDTTEDCTPIELSDEQYERLRIGRMGYAWHYDEDTKEFNLVENFTDDYIRGKRVRLLEAFDKYKTNVIYGITNETSETREIVIAWYNNLLNLKVDAIKNVPDVIKYYL